MEIRTMNNYQSIMQVRRGDIYFVKTSGNQTGSEIKKNRPAIVVSNNKNNMFSNCVEIVFLTTQPKKDLPTHVAIMGTEPSTALCEQVWTVDKERLVGYMKTATDEEMRLINNALMISLGLDEDANGINGLWNYASEQREEIEYTVSQLEEELRCKREYIKGIEETNAGLVEMIEELKADNKYVIKEDCTIEKLGASEELISLRAERNLYKAQYEALLEKVLG